MANEFEFLIYRAVDEEISVNAVINDETIWLTQKAMAELFAVQVPAISKHLKNIFSEGERGQKVVVSKMEIPTRHGAIPDKNQKIRSDFDRQVEKLLNKGVDGNE